MQPVRPSRTALRVALRRAAHQLHDRPLVFEDPIAVPYPRHRVRSKSSAAPPTPHPARRQRPFSIGMRAYLVARSRYAEDALAQAVATGATQYVLLGAGLDTYAHRNPYPHLRVFEVDHPATQALEARPPRPIRSSPTLPSLTYAPIDFERADFECESLPEQPRSPPASTPPRRPSSPGSASSPTSPSKPSAPPSVSSPPSPEAVASSSTTASPAASFHFNEQLAHDSLSARVALRLANPSSSGSLPPKSPANSKTSALSKTSAPTSSTSATSQTAPTHCNSAAAGARILTAWLLNLPLSINFRHPKDYSCHFPKADFSCQILFLDSVIRAGSG